MKPMRGLSGSWVDSMPRERRIALAALLLLLILLALSILYERYTADQGPEAAVGGPTTDQSRAPKAVGEPGPEVSDSTGPGLSESGVEFPGPAEAGGDKPAPAAPEHLLYPLEGTPQVIRGFGHSYSETYGDFRLHPGVDLAAREGDPVRAAASGMVEAAEQDPADGQVLILRHSGGMTTRYAGLGEVYVRIGVRVEEGAIIGTVGVPGPARAALGTSLHFGLLLDGYPIDSGPYLR